LALGIIKQQTGSFVMGFALLGAFALVCMVVAKLTSSGRFQHRAASVV
jgi:nitrate/nitrite transporter NarK